MLLRMKFCRFRGVMERVLLMPVRRVGVMGCRFVVTGFVVPGGFAMMARRMLMMLRCFVVMLGCLLRHSIPPRARPAADRHGTQRLLMNYENRMNRLRAC